MRHPKRLRLLPAVLWITAIGFAATARAYTVTGYTYLQGAIPNVYDYASYFNVAFCLNANGTNCPGDMRTTTNYQGTFSFFTNQPAGNYFLFMWRDDIYWGSSTAPVSPYAFFIYNIDQIIQGISVRPRPLPPTAITPQPGGIIYLSPCSSSFSWTDGLDAYRKTSAWKVTYDLYLGSGGVASSLVATNLSSTSFTGSLPLEAGTTYTWRVVAKLEVFTGIKYETTSASYSFTALAFPVATSPSSFPPDWVWLDDTIPPGASPTGLWLWDTNQKASGTQSHYDPPTTGMHQHYFAGAAPVTVVAGQKLVSYVLLDPCNPPREVMLQWFDGSWEHRAFWGADLLPTWGVLGTSSRRSMGALPALGQWVRLEVPVELLGFTGGVIQGMAFTLYDGKAWFDRAGVAPIPVDDAAFVSQTPPSASIAPGATATVSVTMRNSGTTVWDSNYRLGSQSPQDNQTWGTGRVFLAPGEVVAPGQNKTFTFVVTAPSTASTYHFQWRMVHEMVQWFGAFTPDVLVNVASQTPVDNACFVSQAPPPSSMGPGQSASVSVTLRNCGTTAWTEASQYRLGSQTPANNTTWGLGRVYLAAGESVPPGATKSFSFNVTAPATSGAYNFHWQMVHEMIRWFGDLTPAVAISVGVNSLHAPTNLRYEGFPSRNVLWTPPDNLTSADQVRYDLWLYGPSCPSGCEFTPGAPSWYTIGPSIQGGTYSWKLQAISASRSYSGLVNGPQFTLTQLDLSINRTAFQVSAPDWTITVNSTLLGSNATLVEEYWNGAQWVEDWRGGIGQVPSSGVLRFVDAAPFFAGSFRSHVEAAGSSSNYVGYTVSP